MRFIRLSDGHYPITVNQIKRAYKHTCLPNPFRPPAGFEPVYPTPKVTTEDPLLKVVQVAPVLNEADGKYYQTWALVDRFKEPNKEVKETAYLNLLAAEALALERKEEDETEVSSNPAITFLQDKTIAEIGQHVEDNVNTLGELKNMVKTLAKVAGYIIKRI